MKLMKILIALCIVIAVGSPASAWGFELFGFKIGTQEYQTSIIGRTHVVSSGMSMNVEWYMDGDYVRTDKNAMRSEFTPIITMKHTQNDIVGYKSGKDRITGKKIHKIEAKYSGGERTWFILE